MQSVESVSKKIFINVLLTAMSNPTPDTRNLEIVTILNQTLALSVQSRPDRQPQVFYYVWFFYYL